MLSDIGVLEAGYQDSAPWGGRLLADLGAIVLRLNHIQSDPCGDPDFSGDRNGRC